MWLVLWGEYFPSFLFRFHRFECSLSLCTEQLLNQIFFSLLDILIPLFCSFFFSLKFLFHFFSCFSCLYIANHAIQVSEEGFWMVIHVAFLFCINAKVIGLLECGLIDVWGFAVQVLNLEFHHDFCDVLVDLLDEWCDCLGFWVQFVQASHVVDQLNELIMDLSLVLWFLLLFGNFSVQNSNELWL